MTDRPDQQLTHAQRQIWVGQQLHPEAPLYNMALGFTIVGELNPQLFAESFAYVVATTDSLRTVFTSADDNVTRTVLSQLEFELAVIDCDGPGGAERAQQFMDNAVRKPIDVSTRCFDSALLKCGPDTHIWFLNQHHLIADALAFSLIFQRVAARYLSQDQGLPADAEEHPNFQAFVDQQLSEESQSKRQLALEYWDEKLDSATPRSDLYGRLRADNTTSATRVHRAFGPVRAEKMRQVLQRTDIRSITPELTRFNVVAAVLSAWIERTSGNNQPALGFLGHNRNTREFKATAGTFAELFPLINEVEPTDTFQALVARTAARSMESLRHLGPGLSDPRFTRDLNVVFNLIATTFGEFGDRTVRTDWIHSGHIDAAHDVRAQFYDFEGTGELTAVFDFKDSQFDEQQRSYATDHFFNLLDACLEDPLAPIANITLAGESEQELLLDFARGAAESAKHALPPIVRQFEEQARLHPDRVACWANGEDLTYSDLDHAANELAHRMGALDGSDGGVVAVSVDRSLDFVIAILAAHKAGAAYLPIDAQDPPARRAALVELGGAFAIVTNETTNDVARELAIPALRADQRGQRPTPPEVEVSPDHRAYLLGTSGSTGTPKIIEVEQRNLTGLVAGLADRIYADHQSAAGSHLNVAVVAPFGFDPSVQQIFASLALGHSLHIVPNEARTDGDRLLEFLGQHSIDVCDGTPAHLRMLLNGSTKDLAALTTHFLIGGEVLPKPLALRFLERCEGTSVRLTNLYGPAECCVDSTHWTVERVDLDAYRTVPIGRPLPGVRAYVVDQSGNLQPFGIVGELCVAGSGVARGYVGNPQLTSEKFADDPLRPGERVFRTGDLARMSSSGVIEFAERKDLMVKVQGYRIELSEVETALKAYRSKRRMIPLRTAEPTRCSRCLLSERHVGVEIVDGVCSTCTSFDQQQSEITDYFGDIDDFTQTLSASKAESADYDCMLLYSGGKDSSYVLYRLAALGLKVLAFTFDNGHISDAAFANIDRQTTRLNVDSVVMSAEHMDEIFLESLNEESTVCGGCFRALTTVSSRVAIDHGIGTVVTGLSRGQIFDTKLGQLLAQGVTDSREIENHLRVFRSGYHSRRDRTNALLDIELDLDVLQSMNFVDWFRYDPTTTTDVRTYLQSQDTYWSQPDDTGFCSTNCRMNNVGIAVHSATKGYHNYEQPLSWDIRLGLLDRDDALREVRAPDDDHYIEGVLDDIGYLVREVQDAAVKMVEDETGARQLHAFYVANQALTVDELRASLGRLLPQYMIPARFSRVDKIPLTENGKVDRVALEADTSRPELATPYAAPTSETETALASIWTEVLGIDEVGMHDSFFAIGGDSMLALTVVDKACAAGIPITAMDVFTATTIAGIADLAEQHVLAGTELEHSESSGRPTKRARATLPALTPGERSLLFEQRSNPDRPMLNIGRVYTIQGQIDADRFARSLRTATQRHEPLKLTFGETRVELTAEQAVSVQNWTPIESEVDLAAELKKFQREPFDLENGPLLRCAIHPNPDGSTLVAIALHHVSGDKRSLDILWEDVDTVYSGSTLSASAYGFADLFEWQESRFPTHSDFWLAEVEEWADLPSFAPSQPTEPDDYLTRTASITVDQLRTATGHTPVAAAVTAAAVAVQPFFEDERVDVGLVSSTRTDDDAERLFGYLLNPIPIQLKLDSGVSLAEVARSASVSIGRAVPHRAYPFAHMVADARRHSRRPPGSSVLVSYVDDQLPYFGGERVEQRVLSGGDAVADLALFVELGPNGDVILGVECNGKSIGSHRALTILNRFDRALQLLHEQPQADASQVRATGSALSLAHGSELIDRELLLPKALRHISDRPDATAVTVGSTRLSWGQVGARAQQLADHLRSYGVNKGDRVCVSLSRSELLPITVLGTLLAGAVYVPLDPSHPPSRMQAVIDHVGPVAAIVDTDTVDLAPIVVAVTGNTIGGASWDDSRRVTLDDAPGPDDIAYIMFTSGSTGAPNGVAVTHQQMADSTNARSTVYPDVPTRFAMVSSISFDSSMVGLLWCLAAAAELVLPNDADVHDPDALVRMFHETQPSHLLCVPTLYSLLLHRRSPGQNWPSHVIVAGESCSGDLARRHFASAPASSLTNEYGPTEATVWATVHHCNPSESEVPIGQPIPGLWTAVVDSVGVPVEEGFAGELVIGGHNVIPGYLAGNQNDRFGRTTAERPLGGALDRYFRTGDRVVQRSGTLDFLGRVDDQLSVGGVRLEPSEVEAVLSAVDGVVAAVVVAADVRPTEDILAGSSPIVVADAMRAAAASGDPVGALRVELAKRVSANLRLVGHVEGDVSESDLRRAVAEKLPATHRPTIYVLHETLPRVATGKVDRGALVGFAPPKLPDQAPNLPSTGGFDLSAACQVFGHVLHRASVDPDDSFFDLGGDSLASFELVRQIEDRHGLELPTRIVYDAPTPRLLAEHIGLGSAGVREVADNVITIDIQPTGEHTPLFMLHHVGVNARFARALSENLGPASPVFALFDPTVVIHPNADSVEAMRKLNILEMTRQYADAIEARWPTGPVAVLGHCQGGVFAHEVANLLEQRNRIVHSVIVVFDWHAPYIETMAGPIRSLRYAIERESFKGVAKLRYSGLRRSVLATTRPHSPEAAQHQLVKDTKRAYQQHTYSAYDGRVLVVRQREDPRWPDPTGPSGWGDLLSDLTIEYITGAPWSGPGGAQLAAMVEHELTLSDEANRA